VTLYSAVCRSCGAPRDPTADRPLCRPCLRLYKSTAALYHNDRTGGARASALKNAYTRLGLVPGNVWKMVLR
jgi:hypothetical protein